MGDHVAAVGPAFEAIFIRKDEPGADVHELLRRVVVELVLAAGARAIQDDVRALADLLCMGHGLSVEQVGGAGDVALQEGFHLTHVDEDERPVPLETAF